MNQANKRRKISQGGFWLRLYAYVICYRYRKTLVYPLQSPDFVAHQRLSFEDIQGKARASLTTAGVFFAFSIAALAVLISSDGVYAKLKEAGFVFRSWIWFIYMVAGVILPYFVIWLQRWISEAGNYERKLRDEKRKRRRPFLNGSLLLSLIFFLGSPLLPHLFPHVADDVLGQLFLLSGFILIILSAFFLLLSLQFYDSASGWRLRKSIEWTSHLASIASHSYVMGVATALLGGSLLLCIFNVWAGCITVCLSLVVLIVMHEIERGLRDLRQVEGVTGRKCQVSGVYRCNEHDIETIQLESGLDFHRCSLGAGHDATWFLIQQA
jgi:hypothetical protein